MVQPAPDHHDDQHARPGRDGGHSRLNSRGGSSIRRTETDAALFSAAPGLEMDPDGGTAMRTRMDMHCHSHASSGPAIAALGLFGVPECYSTPEQVYEQARSRGMDLVTITDHDTVAGGLELINRGFENVILGEEVTVFFPEDRCKLHVLVWGLTPEQHEQIGAMGLRHDVYAFAHWLRELNLAHSLAHPLYIQNGRLTRWHLDRCVLLFRCFETINGAHTGNHRRALDRYLATLTPAKVQRLVREHGIEPLWPRVWLKGRTGGSDDHGLLNIGRTWTSVSDESGHKILDQREFLRRVMAGQCEPGGAAGHSSLLAHQLTTVGAHYAARRLLTKSSPTGRYIASKIMGFAGVDVPKPSKARLVLDHFKKKIVRRKKRSLPLLDALKGSIGPVLEKYADLKSRLSPEAWVGGSALSEHERMAEFADDLYAALHAMMAESAGKAFKSRKADQIMPHLMSYLMLEATQLPYYFSLFHQNKERAFVQAIEHESAEPGTGVSVLDRPMKVCLFTDTLGDINGVCRFIQNTATRALESGRDLNVITCTRFTVPVQSNIKNFDPVFATQMPKYENLELALPPITRILRHVDKLQPDVIHISTPGPVGALGLLAAKMLKVPVLGVYHTDFPAYVDKLFDDTGLTSITRKAMSWFYQPFRSVFTRSQDYVESLVELGLARDRMVTLRPGIDISAFHTRYRSTESWSRYEGIKKSSVKVLYCGRVSLEKNLPLLASAWKLAAKQLRERGVEAELIIVGDGPYRKPMEKELSPHGARFLGFRHGKELSTIYASSDLFVFPSITDTLGQVVMESQASGLPVIVSDQGGPKEVVQDGRTGMVLPPDRPQLWADSIVALCTDHARRREMGEAAHDSMQGFSLEHSFDHFWEVHRQAWHATLAEHGIVRGNAHAAHANGHAPHANGHAGSANGHADAGKPSVVVRPNNRISGFEHAAD
jgi:glycosyltransferase involved in cell wall biosynthesis